MKGDEGKRDSDRVVMVSILKLEEGYVGFYEARDENKTYKIGMAYSRDLKKWKKFKKILSSEASES